VREELHLRIDKLLRRERGERLFSCVSGAGERLLLFQVSAAYGEADEKAAAERLEKLGEVLSAVDSPFVPKVRAWNVKKGGVVEMATCDPSGVFVTDLLEDGSMPFPRAVFLWEQVLGALAALNEKGIAYGLVHPSRLMIDRRGKVLLPEAGLVQLLSGHLRQELSYSGSLYQRLLSEPEFVPPELLRLKPATPASDVFQSAVLFYRLVSGQSPFGSGMSLEIFNRALNNQAVPMSQVVENVPDALSELVGACMSSDPASRPANASEVRGSLISLRLPREGLAELLVKNPEKPYSSRFPGILAVHPGGSAPVEELTDPSEIALREEEKEALLGQLEELKSAGRRAGGRRMLPWLLVGLAALLAVFAIPTLVQMDSGGKRAPEGRLPEDSDGLTHRIVATEGESRFRTTAESLLDSVPLAVKEKLSELGISLAGEKTLAAPVLPPYKVRVKQKAGYDVVLEFTSRSRLHSIVLPTPLTPDSAARHLVLYDGAGRPVGIAVQESGGKTIKWVSLLTPPEAL